MGIKKLLKVLVVGSGAREHAFVWKLSRSPQVGKIYIAPGNAGTASLGQNLPIKATDIKALGQAAQRLNIDLVVVGPEAPLADGIVDHFQALGLPIFGPSQQAAQIEASKVFSHQLMEKYGLPCPRGRAFSSFQEAEEYVGGHSMPVVIKADGLAGGKGVTVARSRQEAVNALHHALVDKAFGQAGERVLIEECLVGREASLLAFTDGYTVVPMMPACDYKTALDSNQGPNTGGMGSYSTPGLICQESVQKVTRSILGPAVRAMAQESRTYKGVLYAGLMFTPEGPKVLEFNCRFGDPETQVTLPRLQSDLVEIMLAVIAGKLHEVDIAWDKKACVGVVMASAGYPGDYQTGFPITGLDEVEPGVTIFHAGTKIENGMLKTDGGRVLTVVAQGETVPQARERVYQNLPRIHFQGCHYRRDIAAEEETCL